MAAFNQGELEILAEIDRAFATAEKPVHCVTNFDHCDECADHDAVLNQHTRETIGFGELGNGGWDPMCFASAEAFVYYVPAMARLSLDRDPDRWYVDQFLFHLRGSNIWRMTMEQTSAVIRLVEHLAELCLDEGNDTAQWDDLMNVLRKLYLRIEGLPHPPELYMDLDSL